MRFCCFIVNDSIVNDSNSALRIAEKSTELFPTSPQSWSHYVRMLQNLFTADGRNESPVSSGLIDAIDVINAI